MLGRGECKRMTGEILIELRKCQELLREHQKYFQFQADKYDAKVHEYDGLEKEPGGLDSAEKSWLAFYKKRVGEYTDRVKRIEALFE